MKNQIEIERKFIIERPDISYILSLEGATASEITQIYLASGAHVTHRVRERITDGAAVYTETKKVRIDKMSAYEDEREITLAEYLALAENIKEGSRPLKKSRYTFPHLGLVYEIDVYPEWEHTAIMEVELGRREEDIPSPPFIRVIREVTGMRKYSNAAMSERFPDETPLE